MSLYDDLGVSPDASQEEIKRAGKRKAKESHPDAGGDAADFARSRHALTILSDPASRKRYDETGDDGMRSALDDRPRIRIRQLLQKHLQAALHGIAMGRGVPDVSKAICNDLLREMAEGEQAIQAARAGSEKLRQLRARFKVKKGNAIAFEVIDGALRDNERSIAANEELMEEMKTALQIAEELDFQADSMGDPFQEAMKTVFVNGDHFTEAWKK